MLQYWRFYWPLALTGVAMVLSVQFQNAALARYPEAVTELAVYALGYGAFAFFRASLNFIAQLTTVFARSIEATRRCHRYVFGVSVLIMLPLIYLGHSEGGAWLLLAAFGTDAELTARVQEYLIYLAPIVLLGAQRFYYTGLLADRLGDGAEHHLPDCRDRRPHRRFQPGISAGVRAGRLGSPRHRLAARHHGLG